MAIYESEHTKFMREWMETLKMKKMAATFLHVFVCLNLQVVQAQVQVVYCFHLLLVQVS